MKVIRVPREVDQNGDAFEGMVSQIVAGTNWQNAINHSDLRANDRRQIELDRALRKVGYLYLRKRESKGEAQAVVGNGQFSLVSKERFAQDMVNSLYRAINLIYVQVLRYYKKTRGTGDAALYISQFFRNRKTHHIHFGEFWDVADVSSRTAFSKWMAKAKDAIEAFEE